MKVFLSFFAQFSSWFLLLIQSPPGSERHCALHGSLQVKRSLLAGQSVLHRRHKSCEFHEPTKNFKLITWQMLVDHWEEGKHDHDEMLLRKFYFFYPTWIQTNLPVFLLIRCLVRFLVEAFTRKYNKTNDCSPLKYFFKFLFSCLRSAKNKINIFKLILRLRKRIVDCAPHKPA